MKVKNSIFACSLLILFCLAGCTPPAPKTNDSVLVQTDDKSGKINSNEEANKTGETTAETKTDKDIKIANSLLEVAGDLIKSKQHKDSLMLANREKIFAYQIGLPISNLDEVFAVYLL